MSYSSVTARRQRAVIGQNRFSCVLGQCSSVPRSLPTLGFLFFYTKNICLQDVYSKNAALWHFAGKVWVTCVVCRPQLRYPHIEFWRRFRANFLPRNRGEMLHYDASRGKCTWPVSYDLCGMPPSHWKETLFCKETYNFIDPTDRSHLIAT